MPFRTSALKCAVASLALVAPLFAPAPSTGGPGYFDARADEVATPAFFDDLTPYGVWTMHPVYGAVWQPAEIDGRWRPYQTGRWIYTKQWGWYFEASKPWGDIVFHYGRWAFDGENGWVWVPGKEWGPGWVSWRHGRQNVGWAPMSPRGEERDDPAYWSFVATENLSSSRVTEVSEVVYERPRVRTLWLDTVILGNPIEGRPANRFIDEAVYERETRVALVPQQVEYRVAVDVGGRPIGWNPGVQIGGVNIVFQPARARWDDAPSPLVTQRLLIDIRSGRVREDDPYARTQVVAYAQRGQFNFVDTRNQALVGQLPPRPVVNVNNTTINRTTVINNVTVINNNTTTVNVFNAVRTQNVAVAGKSLPPPAPAAPKTVKFKNPDELQEKPELIGVPAVNRQLPEQDRIQVRLKPNGLVDAPDRPEPPKPAGLVDPGKQPTATPPVAPPAVTNQQPAVQPPGNNQQPSALTPPTTPVKPLPGAKPGVAPKPAPGDPAATTQPPVGNRPVKGKPVVDPKTKTPATPGGDVTAPQTGGPDPKPGTDPATPKPGDATKSKPVQGKPVKGNRPAPLDPTTPESKATATPADPSSAATPEVKTPAGTQKPKAPIATKPASQPKVTAPVGDKPAPQTRTPSPVKPETKGPAAVKAPTEPKSPPVAKPVAPKSEPRTPAATRPATEPKTPPANRPATETTAPAKQKPPAAPGANKPETSAKPKGAACDPAKDPKQCKP